MSARATGAHAVRRVEARVADRVRYQGNEPRLQGGVETRWRLAAGDGATWLDEPCACGLTTPRLRGQERLAHERLVHDAHHRTLAVVQCDQYRPVQLAEDETAGAVDRVDDPGEGRRAGLLALFLAVDAVVGVRTHDLRANHLLRRAVGDGYRVVAHDVALILHVDDFAEVRQNGFAGGERRPVFPRGKGKARIWPWSTPKGRQGSRA
jgi:hypothetical protein